jgi:hypothetical protein
MEKVKIIITVTNDIQHDRRMLRCANTLHQQGFEVMIVGFQRSVDTLISPQVFNTKLLPLIIKKGKLSYIEISIRLFFYLLTQPFNVLISVDMDTIIPGYYVSKLRNKKQVFDSHEWFSEVPELAHRPAAKAIWQACERYYIPKVKLKYTVSQSIANAYISNGYGATKVIRNMPYLINETVENNFSKRIIIYQGATNVGRGLHQLIDAIATVDAMLWIVGNGDIYNEISEKIIQKKMQHKVKMWGYIAPENLNKLTQQASLGYNVLEPLGLSYQYSLANKYFDYINNEIPIITNNFIEYATLNAQHEVAVLVDACEVNHIKTALEKCLNNRSYYEALKANCKLAKQIFNWEKESEKLIEIIKN